MNRPIVPIAHLLVQIRHNLKSNKQMQALIEVELNYQTIFSLCIDKLFLMENVIN